MASKTNKEWYKHGWGLAVAIILFPYFLVWYAWAKSSWNKGVKIAITAVVGLFVLMVLVAMATTDTTTTSTQNNDSKPATEQQQPAENTEPASEVSLAKEVEAKFLEFWGFSDTQEFLTAPDMPDTAKIYGFINGFEDVNDGTVRVYVQTDIDKDEAKRIGIHIMGAVGTDLENLDWLVIRGTDGLDVNVSRNDVPAFRN